MKEGNTVTITVNEYYNKIRLSKDHYEAFKNVINAAADFNKVVLVFEKG
jgi:LAS superfamily LD-carboxypeptidase LdcB